MGDGGPQPQAPGLFLAVTFCIHNNALEVVCIFIYIWEIETGFREDMSERLIASLVVFTW